MSPRRLVRAARTVGLGMLAIGVLTAACSSHAGASTLVSGAVTVTPKTPGGATTPWQSGQVVDITVAANSTLSLSNLESKGGFKGEPSMHVVECVDPGGLVGNLPTTPTYNCDGSTIMSTAYVNADGSFRLDGYTAYALPDSVSLGEDSSSKPSCGSQSKQCVLYIGPDQNDFSKPHLFSAPFTITTDASDHPTALGADSSSGGTGVATAAGSSASALGGGGSGTLAFTGPFPVTGWLVLGGFMLVVVGTWGRRATKPRRLRPGAP